MPEEQGTLFDERFLGRYAGQIMSDPTTAIVELIANAWDAYATKVEIQWPDTATDSEFQIIDNGIGMTPGEFELRWRTLEYNRLVKQGEVVAAPDELVHFPPRTAYGRNGRGRLAGFFFSSPYQVRTWRDGVESTYTVTQGKEISPIEISQKKLQKNISGHGTEISAMRSNTAVQTNAENIRSLISTRFLMNPDFKVYVDGIQVTFDDVPEHAINKIKLEIPEFGTAEILTIASEKADRTTKQHGIAWWVNRKAVGMSGWHGFDQQLIDGRTEEAKRYTFIVVADFLKDAVAPDWSEFFPGNKTWIAAQKTVHSKIKEILTDLTKEKRVKSKDTVRKKHTNTVKSLPVVSQERWLHFLDRLVEDCPSLSESQIDQVMGLLANLEAAESQYSLLDKLHQFSPAELDEWNSVLNEWTITTAKAALDEISKRLKLIEEIRIKTASENTDEVQELQPLFGQALWIFGPQLESIEFTSNKGMTTVIQKIFGTKDTASKNRPDFVARPNSSVGFYSRPSFDSNLNEEGTDVLVIVELKRPGVPIGTEEKGQVWKYVKELISKGYVTDHTTVFGYVLGDSMDPSEAGERKEGERTIIRPMLYNTFIGQAEKRMLNLHKKLTDAPFMKSAFEALDIALPENAQLPLIPPQEINLI